MSLFHRYGWVHLESKGIYRAWHFPPSQASTGELEISSVYVRHDFCSKMYLLSIHHVQSCAFRKKKSLIMGLVLFFFFLRFIFLEDNYRERNNQRGREGDIIHLLVLSPKAGTARIGPCWSQKPGHSKTSLGSGAQVLGWISFSCLPRYFRRNLFRNGAAESWASNHMECQCPRQWLSVLCHHTGLQNLLLNNVHLREQEEALWIVAENSYVLPTYSLSCSLLKLHQEITVIDYPASSEALRQTKSKPCYRGWFVLP